MVQERFLCLKEINLKQLLIFSLILSLNIGSNEVLNKFNMLIKKDLYFSQEIETNTTDKSFSEGSIERYGENIEVISIIDRFLEHARCFIFCNENDPLYFISSADWMGRNIDRRIEVTCPIYDNAIKKEFVTFEIFVIYKYCKL